ncbi:MAG: aminotransferase class V-fold PLP-dependent enzyme [Catonella sp.]|uniref:aminotransferase class V-fold PLP-dependent enzyme n=1 Tax=Catonella sp. TaxID=2382125 RepID=UPI003F9FA667
MSSNFRKDFKFFNEYPDLIYFDNAATTQKPDIVLEKMIKYYESENANPLRGVYDLSVKATAAYENARERTAKFIGAESASEIIFTRNATESLNLIARSYGETFLKEGDEVVLTVMEHHSNLLPWQEAAGKTGAKLVFLTPDMTGFISDEEIEKKITEKTKIVSIAHISNVLGRRNPIEKIIKAAHNVGAVAVIDGAQAVPHTRVNVRELDADFYVFSGHKMLAPMGIGVVYGKKKLLNKMPPFLTGGEMIEYVELNSATYAEVPHKFEAGTVNVGGAVGLNAAMDYLDNIGFDYIEETELRLTKMMFEGMKSLPYINIVGSDRFEEHNGIITFTIDDVHPHDSASILNEAKICVRAGHHCAQPLMKFLGLNSTLRASLYFYNTEEEVERFLDSLTKVRGWLGYGA